MNKQRMTLAMSPRPSVRPHFGWAGSVRDLLNASRADFLESLEEHHRALTGADPSGSQRLAWREEHEVMATAFAECVGSHPAAADWGVVFEFELPFEGGRRPDVVVLAGDAVAVLEFKREGVLPIAYFDQVKGYARDLADYHEGSHGKLVAPVLVSTAPTTNPRHEHDVTVENGTSLGSRLLDLSEGGRIDLESWLSAEYAPLPTLVSAARRIFQHEPLPHVRRALSARIPETVDLVADLIARSKHDHRRRLVLLTGVPGAGKTLVGLRVVYEKAGVDGTEATFLSGNGPLVKVLQDALQSRVFVRDLHRFISSYGLTERVPKQHVLVFDEAQRAWDRAYMEHKKNVAYSEPELLIRIAERLPDWTALVGLVGGGQEIYSGEEGGLAQWREAILAAGNADAWEVHCPPSLAPTFEGLKVVPEEDLELTVSLRSRRAELLHQWVVDLLNGDLTKASEAATTIQAEKFPLYLTRDLGEARSYAEDRYEGEENARYGLLASSHAKRLPKYGVDNTWWTTSKTNSARWYNDGPGQPTSCCALDQPVTEFGCQGLELDLPIVCWGEDVCWTAGDWRLVPARRKYPQKHPMELLRNTYRVLLTRGRDGVVVFVPDVAAFDDTANALLHGGLTPLGSA